jgi:hypothetical protein
MTLDTLVGIHPKEIENWGPNSGHCNIRPDKVNKTPFYQVVKLSKK